MERLLENLKPLSYRLDLIINKTKDQLKGEEVLVALAKTWQISLHAENLVIESVFWRKKETLPWQKAVFAQKDKQLKISLRPQPAEKQRGEVALKAEKTGWQENDLKNEELWQRVELKIAFTTKITAKMEGIYYSTFKNAQGKEERMVSTQFESHYARECFPCVDEPAAKAKFYLTITSENKKDVILANMPAEDTAVIGEAKVVRFKETPPMSTYLLAFALGNFIHLGPEKTASGVVVQAYATANQQKERLGFALDFAQKALTFYEKLFQVEFPLPKLDLLAVPDFEAGAMENWGLVTFRESAILADREASILTKRYVAIVIAHELSHMWFGDLVTMKWWNDLWLNESFANLIEIYAVDKIMPELRAWDDFYQNTVPLALERDAYLGVQAVQNKVANEAEIAGLFDGAIVYAKGSRLLLMLMRSLGEERFFKAISAYFRAHAYGNTEAKDLWEALSKEAGWDVAKKMTPWLEQPGYPMVEFVEKSSAVSVDKQRRFLIDAEALKPKDDLKYPIWQLREDLSGHYLIRYQASDLEKRVQNFEHLAYEEQLRLLIDQQMLARAGKIDSAKLIKLIEQLASKLKRKALLWSEIGELIGFLKRAFVEGEPEEANLRFLAGKIARKASQDLGLKTCLGEDIETSLTRVAVMSLMSYSQDEAFGQRVKQQYAAQALNAIDPNVRAMVLGALLVLDEDEARAKGQQGTRGDFYLRRFLAEDEPALKGDLLVAMGYTKEPAQGERYLNAIKEGKVRVQEQLLFLLRLMGNVKIRQKVLTFIYENWDFLEKGAGKEEMRDYPRYMVKFIHTEAEAVRFKQFFAAKAAQVELKRDLTIAARELRMNLKLRREQQAAVKQALRSLRSSRQ